MNNNALPLALYRIGAVQFGEFTLKSGQTSRIYLNLRKIISYPELLRHIAEAMWQLCQSHPFNLVCGVPYTALPIATCLSLDHNLPMVMRRKETKDYGTKQRIEGHFKPEDTALVIEDVITTGGSILETTADLNNENIRVTDVVALIDREQGGVNNLKTHYRVHTVLSLTELLNTLLTSPEVSETDKQHIQHVLAERANAWAA